jgi:hypothetical protein
MAGWRECWRNGFALYLTTDGLRALRTALIEDDPRLIQGHTTVPAASYRDRNRVCRGACAIGYCYWVGHELRTVGEVRLMFEMVTDDADSNFPGQARELYGFIRWFDRVNRARMRAELLPEVERELHLRRRRAKSKARRRELATVGS